MQSTRGGGSDAPVPLQPLKETDDMASKKRKGGNKLKDRYGR
jgi:hypothetical protein